MDDDNDTLIIIATVLLSFFRGSKNRRTIWVTRIRGYDDKEVWLLLKIQKSPKLP